MYGPNLNLVRDPRWGRAQEVYSEDPELTSALTVGCVSGIQAGKGLDDAEPEPMLAAACCKHFAAYNVETIPTDRYHFDANVSTSTDLLFWGTCRRRTLTAGAGLQLKRTHLILSDATLGSLGVRRWHVLKKKHPRSGHATSGSTTSLRSTPESSRERQRRPRARTMR